MDVTVTGRVTGDNECWCMRVSEEEYRKICGEDAWRMERQWREDLAKEEGEDPSFEVWTIYPSDLMRALGIGNEMKVSFQVSLVTHHLECGCVCKSPAYVLYGPNSHRYLDRTFYCDVHAPEGAVPYNPKEIL